ncbi:15271_t:CDS:1 [Dentiscutata erythropus]|uniref:15271_t:CDS:1 n=1 Tax=Dentiscutata erythropus TaxID=1348616 RepID=A0A9N9ISF4_9GLOM|nr:15271_t:CDS:1 [Dentiscutata erythropus]
MSTTQQINNELEKFKNDFNIPPEKFANLKDLVCKISITQIYEIPTNELEKYKITNEDLEKFKRIYEISDDELKKLQKYELTDKDFDNLKNTYKTFAEKLDNLKNTYKTFDEKLDNLKQNHKSEKPTYVIPGEEVDRLKIPGELKKFQKYELTDKDFDKLKNMYKELDDLKQKHKLSEDELKTTYVIPGEEVDKLKISGEKLKFFQKYPNELMIPTYVIPGEEVDNLNIPSKEFEKLQKYELTDEDFENLKQMYKTFDDELDNLKHKLSEDDINKLKIPSKEFKKLQKYELTDQDFDKLKNTYKKELDDLKQKYKLSEDDINKLKSTYVISGEEVVDKLKIPVEELKKFQKYPNKLKPTYVIPGEEVDNLKIPSEEFKKLQKYELTNKDFEHLEQTYKTFDEELEKLIQSHKLSEDDLKKLESTHVIPGEKVDELKMPGEELKKLQKYELSNVELNKLKLKYEISDNELDTLKKKYTMPDGDFNKLKTTYGVFDYEFMKLERMQELKKLKTALDEWKNTRYKAYSRSILCLIISSMGLVISIFLLVSYQSVIESGITNIVSGIYAAGSFSVMITNLKTLNDIYTGGKSDKSDIKEEEISDDLIKKSLKNHPHSLYPKIFFVEAVRNNISYLLTVQTIIAIITSVILLITSIITILYWFYGSDEFQSANYALIVMSSIGLYESIGFVIGINLIIHSQTHKSNKNIIAKHEKAPNNVPNEKCKILFNILDFCTNLCSKVMDFCANLYSKVNCCANQNEAPNNDSNKDKKKGVNVVVIEVTVALMCEIEGLTDLTKEVYKENAKVIKEDINDADVYFNEEVHLVDFFKEASPSFKFIEILIFSMFFPVVFIFGVVFISKKWKFKLRRTHIDDLEIEIINNNISGLDSYPPDLESLINC